MWLLVDIRESTLCNCMLHTQHCRPVAVAVIGASCLWLPGSRMWRHADNEPRLWQRVVRPQQRRRCAPEAEPRAPSKKQKQVAESGAALHEFIYALHHPPLSFSLLYSYPAPPPPPDSPLNVALRCLPCLLLSSSRFPCKRTNNKKSSAFKSARSFLLHCSYSRS